MESNQRYYSRRASEERRAAARAVTPEARDRHKALAQLFEEKARQSMRERERPLAESRNAAALVS